MWALAAGFSLVIAIAGHAALCRLPLALTSVARFLLAGTASGIGLCIYCVANWGLSAESAASIALYAAACELYIFLFTVTAGSISVSLLYRLRSGPLSESQIEAALGGRSMVDRRIRNMLAIGLLEEHPQGYVKTARGGLILWLYRALRRFFWRPPLIPSVITPTEPGPLSLAMPDRTMEVVRNYAANTAACFLLLATVAAMFWKHLSGAGVFIGDSDRLNHYLSILRMLTEGYREGAVRTWDELIFGGFDVTTFTPPAPTSALHLLWPAEDLFFAAGIVSALILTAAGCAAYLFIKDVCKHTFASLVGAGLYMMSALSILKVSQNDTSFSSFVLIPIILLVIRRTDRGNSARCFIGLTLALTYFFIFSFLQKAAYALLLATSYALYRAYQTRNHRVLAVFALATLTSLAASFPRIYAMGEEFLSSARYRALGSSSENLRASTVSQAYEVLRWFDDRIFGSFAAETSVRNASVNMHEGFLLYISTFAALLLLFAFTRHVWTWKSDGRALGSDAPFFIATIVFCFLVILTRTGAQLMHLAFLRIDFIHARVAIAALLPMCALVALSLLKFQTNEKPQRPRAATILASLFFALACVAIIEAVAGRFDARYIPLRWPGTPTPIFIASSAVVRILLSLCLFAFVVLVRLPVRRFSEGQGFVVYAVGFLMLGQVFIYARDQIAGAHTRSPTMPFARHIRLLAEPTDFNGPSAATARALRERLEAAQFRTSVVCNPGRTAIYCSPHVSHFWGLRMIDGYLNAVPARIGALPFTSQALGARVLTFSSFEQLPWPLLAMLNVKYAVEANRALFTNAVALPTGAFRELRPEDVRIVESPITPTPRVFFAQSVNPVKDMREAAEALFRAGRVPSAGVRVEERSFAEGISDHRTFSTSGDVRIRFAHQHVDIEVDPSAQARFLVLNERFHRRWKAYAGGAEIPVYPTNVFMRGMLVPPGTTVVTMRYVPFMYSPIALACYAVALVLLGFGLFAFRRRLDPLAIRRGVPDAGPAPVAEYSRNRPAGE